MGAFIRFLGPQYLIPLVLMLGVGAWWGSKELQIWWAKDRRAYCEAKLTDYELKSKAALEKITLERNDLKARLETNEHEHKTRVAAMRVRHERAFDSLSAAYQDSCARLSQAPEAASGDDGGTGDNGLPAGVAGRIHRIAVIGDIQAEQLQHCQGYVRALQ